MNIKKGDNVKVIVGKDRGKEGKVLRAFPKKNQILVEGLNMVKRHEKATANREAGIVARETPLNVSNVKKI